MLSLINLISRIFQLAVCYYFICKILNKITYKYLYLAGGGRYHFIDHYKGNQ